MTTILFDWLKRNFAKLPVVNAKSWVIDTQDPDRYKSTLRLLQEGLHPADVEGIRETTFFEVNSLSP
jgi:hypothetical protein